MLDRQARRTSLAVLSTLALLPPCLLFVFPFAWMMLASSKTNAEIFTPFPLWPRRLHFAAYRALLGGEWAPFVPQYLNTLMIAGAQTLLASAFALAAGFVFARYTFRGAGLLYTLAITAILIPQPVLIIPLSAWLNALGLTDTPWGVILPGTVSGLGVLFFTQIFRRVPGELIDAARVEGASDYRLLPLLLPLVKPAVATYGLLHFILAWHDHLVPLVVLSTPERLTVSVSLASMAGSSLRIPFAAIMAGATLTVLPTVLFFLIVRRHLESTLSAFTEQ